MTRETLSHSMGYMSAQMDQQIEGAESELVRGGQMAQIFLYRAGAKLSQQDLKALRDVGLIPVKVARFDDVRLIDPSGRGSEVWAAAMEAIATAGTPVANGAGVKTLFGRLIAEKLANATVFRPDGRPHGT